MAFQAQPQARAIVTLDQHFEAKHQGVSLSVPGAFAGERVAVRLLARVGKQWVCRVEQVLTPSPDRRQPPCPIWRPDCACPLMPLAPTAQARFKAERAGAADTVQAEQPLHYRSKVVLVARHGKLGAYRRGSHAFLDLAGCVIEEEPIARAITTMRRLLADVPSFDDRNGSGDLRYVVLRANAAGEVLVTWIGARPPPLARVLLEQAPQVKGVLFAENIKPGNAIWDKPAELLAGVDHLLEEIDGLRFRVSPQSFFQVHRAQAARLRQSLRLEGRVWDLYCGVGVNALAFAKAGHEVHGIEGFAGAVADARQNAKLNGLDAMFTCADLEKAELPDAPVDTVVLNPPRKGAPLTLVEAIAKRRPKRITYIACAPKPLHAAAALLAEKQYQIEHIGAFDLFPQTEHVETVAHFKLA